jgi:hypothetical protein
MTEQELRQAVSEYLDLDEALHSPDCNTNAQEYTLMTRRWLEIRKQLQEVRPNAN